MQQSTEQTTERQADPAVRQGPQEKANGIMTLVAQRAETKQNPKSQSDESSSEIPRRSSRMLSLSLALAVLHRHRQDAPSSISVLSVSHAELCSCSCH